MPTQSGGHVVRIEVRRNHPQVLDGLPPNSARRSTHASRRAIASRSSPSQPPRQRHAPSSPKSDAGMLTAGAGATWPRRAGDCRPRSAVLVASRGPRGRAHLGRRSPGRCRQSRCGGRAKRSQQSRRGSHQLSAVARVARAAPRPGRRSLSGRARKPPGNQSARHDPSPFEGAVTSLLPARDLAAPPNGDDHPAISDDRVVTSAIRRDR